MDTPRLPGTDDDRSRVVCHVDADCFYAACERLREPKLRGEPVVVGMGYEPGEQHGAVATASYEARAHGIESAMSIERALDILPRVAAAGSQEPAAYYRSVDMEHYESVAASVRAVLTDAAEVVREVSIDEAYLDVTDLTSWGVVARTPDERGAVVADGTRRVAEGYARHLVERVADQCGVPVSVGVAPTMSAAKVASDHDKPAGLVVVPPGEVQEFLAPLPTTAVHGVGPVTASELRDRGIETAGDVAAADPDRLEQLFGERGRELHDRARGVDPREVTPRGAPNSLSRESAFADPTADTERVRDRIRALADDVATRAEREGALYRTIGVKLVEPPFDVSTRERSLHGPVRDADLVREVALDLATEFAGRQVRKVGVRVSNLSFADGEQAGLDDWATANGRTETDDTSASGRQAPLDAFDDGC